MGMFDNFTPTEISCNRPTYHYDDDTAELVIGATNTHLFNAPFLLSEYCKSFDIIYRQGLTVVITKHYDFSENMGEDIEVNECDDKDFSIVKVIISSEESKLFKNSVLECQAQMKLYMQDDTILYSDSYDINVKSPLDNKGV